MPISQARRCRDGSGSVTHRSIRTQWAPRQSRFRRKWNCAAFAIMLDNAQLKPALRGWRVRRHPPYSARQAPIWLHKEPLFRNGGNHGLDHPCHRRSLRRHGSHFLRVRRDLKIRGATWTREVRSPTVYNQEPARRRIGSQKGAYLELATGSKFLRLDPAWDFPNAQRQYAHFS
jgi:hypothetical protein